MPDFRELFTSPDFEAYQDRVVDEVVAWTHQALYADALMTCEQLRTGIGMARMILELPAAMIKSPELKQRLAAKARARLMELPSALLRKEMVVE